ncbi:MAG: DUF642 domain-containing protein, partial [Verrucomicrobiales bacterium]|nr:DUF642 domain-containing protein [Verrucomicrobiales bacterium]
TILDGAGVFSNTDIGLGFPWPTTIADGKQAVDLPPGVRKGGGGIQQTFPTAPGKKYQLTFDLGTALSHGRDGTGNVEVEIAGITQTYSVSTASPDWDWSSHGFTFKADDTSATLVFRSFDDPEFHFASVDHISVRAGVNVLVNPSFEEPNPGYPNSVDLLGGSTYLNGWTTILDGVGVFSSTDIGLGFPWPTTIADGQQAVDLAPGLRSGGGGIQQSFLTNPGRRYEVTFDLGTSLSHGRDGTGNVEAEVDGIKKAYALHTSNPDWEWSSHGFTFKADDTSATLAFRSFDNPADHFASVDNVSVRALPEGGSTSRLLVGVLLSLHACLRWRRGA